MKTLRLTLAAAALALSALPAMADKIPLNRISNYFNGFATAQGTFTQINADGTISTGTLYIRRPGRVRFEYNPPDNSLVLASGGQVAVFDPKSNQPPDQYPLRRTPLNIILEKTVDLNRARMVVGHTSDDNSTTVIAQDPEHPEYGQIALVFTDNPVQLRKWVITDGAGDQTSVILNDLSFGQNHGTFVFSIHYEIEKRFGERD